MKRYAVGTLSLSAVGFVAIVLLEGYSDRAIIPVPGDVPTIGFGTTEGVKPGDTITAPRAVERALKDVAKFEQGLRRCVQVPLHQYEYDAYVGFMYNVGIGAFCKSTLVKKLNAEDYSGACAEISRWTRFQGKDCRDRSNKCYGLVVRRDAERAKCEGK